MGTCDSEGFNGRVRPGPTSLGSGKEDHVRCGHINVAHALECVDLRGSTCQWTLQARSLELP